VVAYGGGFHAGAFPMDLADFMAAVTAWHGGFAGVHNGFGYGHGSQWYHGWRGGRYGWW
jgi:hypothetical protein